MARRALTTLVATAYLAGHDVTGFVCGVMDHSGGALFRWSEVLLCRYQASPFPLIVRSLTPDFLPTTLSLCADFVAIGNR